MVTPVRKTVRIPLAPVRNNPSDDDITTGGYFSNCILDTAIDGVTGDKTTYVTKRPGIISKEYYDASSMDYGTSQGGNQGIWLFKGFLLIMNSNVLYYWDTANGSTTAPTAMYTFNCYNKYYYGSSYQLWTKFGTQFTNDFTYSGVLFLEEGQEKFYITNGIEDFIVHWDTTTSLPSGPTPKIQANNFVPNSYYKAGDKVVATTYPQEAVYVCIGEAGVVNQAGAEPTWPTTYNGEVTTGSTTWTRLTETTNTLTAQSYTNRLYAVAELVKPSVETGYYYIVTTGGTTTAEPTWTQIKNDTCTDSGVVFECLGNYGGKPGLANPSSPVYLDTFLILAAYETSDIYHSDPADSQSWNPLNFISADSFTSPIVGLQRYNNYVLALGHSDAELFYNNANASGSTLSRHESFLLQVGVTQSKNIVGTESIISWVGTSSSGARTVWLLDGFEPREISTPWINRILDSVGSDNENYKAASVRVGGHLYLLFPYDSSYGEGWLVFDVNFKQWYNWWFNNPGFFNFLNYVASDQNYTYMCPAFGRAMYLMDNNNLVDVHQDTAGTLTTQNILAEVRTLPIDMGTQKRKFLYTLDVISTSLDGTLGIAWDEGEAMAWTGANDFATTIDAGARKRVTPCGSFRRRGFTIYHDDNDRMRLEALELTYTEGRV